MLEGGCSDSVLILLKPGATFRRIAQHRKDIEDLKEESKMFDLRWEMRKKQFTTTALALHDFQTMLKDGNDATISLLDDGGLADEDEEEGAVEETGAEKGE